VAGEEILLARVAVNAKRILIAASLYLGCDLLVAFAFGCVLGLPGIAGDGCQRAKRFRLRLSARLTRVSASDWVAGLLHGFLRMLAAVV
jgi:hypothetical protein